MTSRFTVEWGLHVEVKSDDYHCHRTSCCHSQLATIEAKEELCTGRCKNKMHDLKTNSRKEILTIVDEVGTFVVLNSEIGEIVEVRVVIAELQVSLWGCHC